MIYRITCLIVSLLFMGCVSMMERSGRVIDGSVFAEKKLAVYRAEGLELTVAENRDSVQSVIISINKFPMIKLRCAMPNDEGVFFLSSLEYLAGNTHGWNEFSLQMLGSGRLLLEENAVLEHVKDIEQIQITAGRIHRYDTRLTGNEALTALRNRNERIKALSEWMVSVEDAPKGQPIKEFSNYWKPILLPETVSKRKAPTDWRHTEDSFERAEDINWNTCYTTRLFPDELHTVRNSGTLLRDWEEALFWIYFMYEWENIVNLFSQNINLQKIK